MTVHGTREKITCMCAIVVIELISKHTCTLYSERVKRQIYIVTVTVVVVVVVVIIIVIIVVVVIVVVVVVVIVADNRKLKQTLLK